MPHEKGKSKHGSAYYSQVGKHRRIEPTSLSPILGSNSTRSPHSDQNWGMDAQDELHWPNLEPTYGGCILEEEIPLNWEEILPKLQDIVGEQMTQTGIKIPLNSSELVMTGYLVEEEFPPLMSNCCKNFVDPNVEDPGIKWGNLWNEEDNHDPPNMEIQAKVPMQLALDSHDILRSCRLTEDHLTLIFEMRRDLAEQLHNQIILRKRLDILFDSTLSEDVKIRCMTCCQPYTFTVRQEGCSGSPHV